MPSKLEKLIALQRRERQLQIELWNDNSSSLITDALFGNRAEQTLLWRTLSDAERQEYRDSVADND